MEEVGYRVLEPDVEICVCHVRYPHDNLDEIPAHIRLLCKH